MLPVKLALKEWDEASKQGQRIGATKMEKGIEIFATKKSTKLTLNVVLGRRAFWKNLIGNSVPCFHFLTDEKQEISHFYVNSFHGQDFHNHSIDRPHSS